MHPIPLCTAGHVSRGRDLIGLVTASELKAAVRAGEVIRVRRGVFVCAHADSQLIGAATVGGALTCTSILAEQGVWVGTSTTPHLQMPPTARRPTGSATLHWVHPRFGMETPWRTTRLQALWQAIHCLDAENALAAIESAIHLRFVSGDELKRLLVHAPQRLHSWMRHLSFTSQSGNESVVRVRLQRVGYSVVSQGLVPGMGHEDLVIEDCVGLDVDGRRWHGEDRFLIDRDRDLRVEGFGRSALRIAAPHIWESWPSTLAVIDRVVADALRERRRRGGVLLKP